MKLSFFEFCSADSGRNKNRLRGFHCEIKPLFQLISLILVLMASTLSAQIRPNRIMQSVDSSQSAILSGHHPLWANAANDLGSLPADQQMASMTLVLQRSPQQEAALLQLLNDQQNPTSPLYHHWLTPAEVGARFGLSDSDLSTLTGWLQGNGLHVNWISPSRIFLNFGGTAADTARAFQSEFHSYNVRGESRFALASEPQIPLALAPAIKAVHGLYTLVDQPNHLAQALTSDSPQVTSSTGNHYVAPADFATIYNIPSAYTGSGYTIGIVGRSRTNMADFDNFKSLTGVGFSDPTEVVPTALGGIDPGPAYTVQTSSSLTGDQGEATLDVLRAGSTAPGANLLLVVATSKSGGIEVDAQYIVQTTPVPAQVMSISFGDCESDAGSAGVNAWDSLFQQAALEGISVFVSSGDSAAAGCDSAFSAAPVTPVAISPNYICSSSYATCVGGTEFADTASPSTYWNSSNSSGYLSALSYIPEGGWNDPTGSSGYVVAGSGGGVSSIIATPSWQTGTGVPTARSGRYTPDVSFSGSCHDGYFACFAAGGGSCVANSNGGFSFESFCGTSASAPAMAAVAALLDQKLGKAQGNLNPGFYATDANTPSAFHDVTVASSGVSGCAIGTPSMCNNSVPSSTALTGGQTGYLVTTGYDEVTGLGSLNVNSFLNDYATSTTSTPTAPTISITPSPSSITVLQSLSLTVTVAGSASTPTGSILLSGGGYTSVSTALSNGKASFNIPAQTLSVGSDTLTANFTPDSNSSSTYSAASGTGSVTVSLLSPTVTATPTPATITSTQGVTVAVTVNGGLGNPTPTGSVTLSGGGYSKTMALSGGTINFVIPATTLTAAADLMTASFSPDTTSSSIYSSNSGTTTVTVTAVTPSVTVTPSPTSINTAQALTLTISVSGGVGSPTPSGTVSLTGSSTGSTTLSNGAATFNIAAGALTAGTNNFSVAYSPDSNSSPVYASASGSTTVTVVTAFTLNGTAVTATPGSTTGNTSTITVTPGGSFTGNVALTASLTSGPTGYNTTYQPTFSFGATTPCAITTTSACTATMTVTTTAATTSALSYPKLRALPWYAAGGPALAAMLLFGIPARRRKLFRILAAVILAALAGGMVACGGGTSSGGGGGGGGGIAGTTTGTYTVTVTGTSGATTNTTAVSVTVQ